MTINYETFDDAWKEETAPIISECFNKFTPLSAIMEERTDITELNLAYDFKDYKIQNNSISVNSSLSRIRNPHSGSFEELFKDNSKFENIKNKIIAIEKYVAQRVKLVRELWLTFGSNVTGATECSQHVHHPLLQNRANVWAVAVPLYFDNNITETQKFYHTILKESASFDCVGDYRKVYDMNIKYRALELPRNGDILSVQFDSMRVPHYVNYTNDVYLWLTFDGVVYKHSTNHEPNQIIVTSI